MSSVGLAIYGGATRLLSPFARALLRWRARRGKEDPDRLDERLGRTWIPRPSGPLVWLHGASLGEGLSLLPLIERLRPRGFTVLLTTGTVSSAHVLAGRLPAGAIHQFAPLDLPAAVCAFLDHWRPQLLLLVESEVWPNILRACALRNVPVALVNARMSDRSYARWRRVPRTARALLRNLAIVAAQSAADAARFSALGAPHVAVAGSLKHDVAVPSADPLELARLRASVGSRPVFCAASTHDGDEAMVLAAHVRAARSAPDLLTVIVPRDVTRAAKIVTLAQQRGLAVVTRRSRAPISADVAVLVADTYGEMGLWLRLASIVVIGKTFGAGGGQTPIEAARCGAAILHGRSVSNFTGVFDALDAAGGALCVDAAHVPDMLVDLLHDAERRRAMSRVATAVVESLGGATGRTLDLLAPLLAHAGTHAR